MGVKEYNFLIKGLSKILNLNEKIDLNDKKKESIEQLIVENRSVNDDLRDDLRAVRIRLNKVKKELEELENISVEDKINKLKELQNRCAHKEMEYSSTPEVNSWLEGRIDKVKEKWNILTNFINIVIIPIILIIIFTGPMGSTGSNAEMAQNILLQCCFSWFLLIFIVFYIANYFENKSVSKIELDWSKSDDKKSRHLKQMQRETISQMHSEIAKLKNEISVYENKKITLTEEIKSTEKLIIEIEQKLKSFERKLSSKLDKLLLVEKESLELKKHLNEIFNSIEYLIPKSDF